MAILDDLTAALSDETPLGKLHHLQWQALRFSEMTDEELAEGMASLSADEVDRLFVGLDAAAEFHDLHLERFRKVTARLGKARNAARD